MTGGHFVEIDVTVPELAEADPLMQRQPWLPLARATRDPASTILVWTRDRSRTAIDRDTRRKLLHPVRGRRTSAVDS